LQNYVFFFLANFQKLTRLNNKHQQSVKAGRESGQKRKS